MVVTRKSRVFLLCYGVTAALLLICVAILYNGNVSYDYKGHKLRLSSVGENNVVMADDGGGELVVTLDDLNGMPIEFGVFSFTVNYLGETLRYDSDLRDLSYIFSDGSGVVEDTVTVTFSGLPELQSALTPLQQEEKQLLLKLAGYVVRERTLGLHVLCAVMGLVTSLTGLGLLFYPEAFWRWRMALWVYRGEPTGWAILMERMCGIALIVGSYVIVFRFLL